MAGILKIRNPDTGEFVEIPAIQGPQGPQGEPGNIGDLTINGKHPDETGSMTLTASDISYGDKTVADELGRSITIQLDEEGNGTIVYSEG